MPRIRIPASVRALCALTLFILLATSFPEGLDASGTSKKKSSSGNGPAATEAFNEGLELVKKGRFEDALASFRQADAARHNDPEILNMLAYTLRKTGHLDEAFEHYAKALKLKPRFPQAREYLGEAHLQALLQQIATLRSYGPEATEEAEQLAAALKRAAAAVDSGEAELRAADW